MEKQIDISVYLLISLNSVSSLHPHYYSLYEISELSIELLQQLLYRARGSLPPISHPYLGKHFIICFSFHPSTYKYFNFYKSFQLLKKKKNNVQTLNNLTFITSSIQYKITRHVIQHQEKNKSIDINPEMTKTVQLIDEVFKNSYYKYGQGLKGSRHHYQGNRQ